MAALRNSIPAMIAIGAILFAWQASFGLGVVTLTSLPSPWGIARSLAVLVRSGDLLDPLVHTLWIVLVGSACAIMTGVTLGAVLGLSKWAYKFGMASIDFMRTVPVVALLPVAVMLWGPSNHSELIIAIYAGTWIMAVNTAGAFASVHPRLADVVRTLHLTRLDGVTKVWLPAITASLLVGARLSVVTTAISVIIAETLVNPRGLGWEIVRAQQSLQPERLWAFAFIAGLFGYLLNRLLFTIVNFLSPGGNRSGSSANEA